MMKMMRMMNMMNMMRVMRDDEGDEDEDDEGDEGEHEDENEDDDPLPAGNLLLGGTKGSKGMFANIKGVAGYGYICTHSTLLTCTRSGAAKSTPSVNGTGGEGEV